MNGAEVVLMHGVVMLAAFAATRCRLPDALAAESLTQRVELGKGDRRLLQETGSPHDVFEACLGIARCGRGQ